MRETKSFGQDLKDAALRIVGNTALFALLIVCLWLLESLYGATLGAHDPEFFKHPPASWMRVFSIWGIFVVLIVHSLTEMVVLISHHISRSVSDVRGEEKGLG